MDPRAKRLALIEGYSSIGLNVVLFCLKYWAGIASGSIALIADAWHTLSDSLTSVIVVVGTKISSKPADREHPFGHGRAEIIGTLIIGVLLSVVGGNFIVESIHKLKDHQQMTFRLMAVIVTVISIIAKEGMAQYAFWAFRKTGSRVLRADGWHHRSDALSSLLVLIGLFLGRIYWWSDGVLGILVAVLIIYSAFDILKDAVKPLMGEKPDDKLLKDIGALAEELDIVPEHLHHYHMHTYGSHTEMTFHIRIKGDRTLDEAHYLTEKLETVIRDKLNIEATIHVEPDYCEHH